MLRQGFAQPLTMLSTVAGLEASHLLNTRLVVERCRPLSPPAIALPPHNLPPDLNSLYQVIKTCSTHRDVSLLTMLSTVAGLEASQRVNTRLVVERWRPLSPPGATTCAMLVALMPRHSSRSM